MARKFFIAAISLGATLLCNAATTDTLAIETKFLATPENVIVITPDIASEVACPTVYILNGYSDNHLQWSTHTRPDIDKLADQYGMILVMPDGRDSWYWNSPIEPSLQMESFITEDLVPYIDAHYNTIANPEKRAITGLSMGGHGAFWLAMHHPDIWKNAGSMSGGVDIRPFPNNWKIKDLIGAADTNPQAWEDYTVINLAPTLKPGEINLTFDCGTEDFFFDVNNNLHVKLLEAGIPHDYTVRPGGHTHEYWANSILYHLLFFNENFKKSL